MGFYGVLLHTVSGQGIWPSLGCFIACLVMPSGGRFVIMTFRGRACGVCCNPLMCRVHVAVLLEEFRTIQQRLFALMNCLLLVVNTILR